MWSGLACDYCICSLSLAWTASNRSRSTMAGCSPGSVSPLKTHLSNVKAIAKKIGERTAREGNAADRLP